MESSGQNQTRGKPSLVRVNLVGKPCFEFTCDVDELENVIVDTGGIISRVHQ